MSFPPHGLTNYVIAEAMNYIHERAVQTALAFIEDRIRDLWQVEAATYPNEYEFRREYGPDIWR